MIGWQFKRYRIYFPKEFRSALRKNKTFIFRLVRLSWNEDYLVIRIFNFNTARFSFDEFFSLSDATEVITKRRKSFQEGIRQIKF